MGGVVAAVALLLAGLTAAFRLTWRKWAREPAPVAAKVEGPTCYPRVRR